MRILHFSDTHIGIGLREVPLGKWMSKRALGGLNLLLGRQRHFLGAAAKLEALARFRREEAIDFVVCSGDLTALGLDREFRQARELLKPLIEAPLGYVGIPGNHDLYVSQVVRERRFRRYFPEGLESDLPEARVEGPWPLVRLVGEGLAVVAVNSSRPNLLWRSNGRIPPKQLAALQALARDSRLRDRFLLVLTHYAPRLADGGPDRRLHGLVNAERFLEICGEVERGAILCGHMHECYHLAPPALPLPLFCAGSATMNGREGFWVFDLERGRVLTTPARWEGSGYRLDPERSVEV